MDEWLQNVVRQLILYSLPVVISLTLVILAETKLCRQQSPHPFYAIFWRGTWLPLLAGLCFQRGVIIALPQPQMLHLKAAAIRFSAHLFLTLLGFLLYSWSLAHQPPIGLPPLHHWWAKVLMFFNLCMAAIHLLPLPMLLIGALLKPCMPQYLHFGNKNWLLITLLTASPLLDITLGNYIIYPIYEDLSTLANHL